MIIRAATDADLDVIARVTRDALSFASSPDAYEWDAASDKDLHHRLRTYLHSAHGGHGAALVVEIDADVVGVVACRIEDAAGQSGDRAAIVDILAVAGSHRGKGLGTHLVQELKRHLTDHNVARLDVEVLGDNDSAQGFWRRAGFREIAIRMSADLRGPTSDE